MARISLSRSGMGRTIFHPRMQIGMWVAVLIMMTLAVVAYTLAKVIG